MAKQPDSRANRRKVLKSIGAAAGVTAIAGCLGNNTGGDGGDGGDDGTTEGTTDGDTTTGDSGNGEPTEVRAAVPPTGWWAVLRKLAQEEGYYQEAADEVGTNVELSFENTWDDVPTWTAGKADIAQFGALEATRIGPRQDIPITVFGKFVPLNFGPMVKAGGELDPANTGSVQASVDKMANEGHKMAIGSWGGADATAYDVGFSEGFGYRFKEQGGDFNTVTAGYFSIGKLVADGKVAAGSTGEGMGAAPQMMAGDIKPLFWLKDLVPQAAFGKETKWGFPTMQNLVTRTSFYEENKKAVETYYRAQEKALQKLRQDPLAVITRSDEYVETIGAGSEEEAEYIVDYGINLKGTDAVPAPKHKSIYETSAMSDEYVETQSQFFDDAAEKGLTETNWKDYVSYVQF